MTDVVEITVTCPDQETARLLSRSLLEARLVACCNIGRQVDSRYIYKGRMERDDKWPLSVKTLASRFDAVATLIRANHPYETPAIFGHAISHVDDATRAWIVECCSNEAG